MDIQTQASGSPYFSLGAPVAYKVENGMELAGRVCRRVRTTLLSPSGVRLEHIGVSGDRLQTAHASVGAIYRSADQACTRYVARVAWTMVDGEAVRACFDRGKACPINSPVKAVIAAPSPLARP
ncbi:hypothetical protein NDN01_13115 [Sphingomonas sp. QA11]|uniref:hypothetical protein n=1 Tax=Sphingomonas sp. QA11 TaxID=2950605 RepID=UPI00234A70CA|nr:hypothetical protein [Sphingomonas sp. QA11]WCM25028.1 hypothetical protein NDN01_13115 [Sphingomonas sp. QA11]